MSEAGKMWGGRFQGELDPFFANFQKSLPVDRELVFADLETNRAWSAALARAGQKLGIGLRRRWRKIIGLTIFCKRWAVQNCSCQTQTIDRCLLIARIGQVVWLNTR